ncbi:MAG: DegT/DnrJ/EryC1/StrS family aminotransferase [Bacteroidota bacterium]
MKVPFYGHVRQYQNIKAEIDANIQKVIFSEQYTLGRTLKEFEEAFAKYCQRKYAIGVNSGTDAIWLALMALDIGPGDECIVPGSTFFATAEAVWITGATPVFVDIDPLTKCIDTTKIEQAISEKTKAIIPVHFYGQLSDMRSIHRIAQKHNLYIVEDSAQAIDAHGDGFAIGEYAQAATFSFIAQKNLGTFGDSGAIVTDDEKLATRLRMLRNHGSLKRGQHSFGFNSRLDDIHAGILLAKLKHIHQWTNQRRSVAHRYSQGLSTIEDIRLPYEIDGYRHCFHLYVIETKQAKDRDPLLQYLQDHNIEAKTHYPISTHLQDGFPWGKPFVFSGDLAHAEDNTARCISLPMNPELRPEEVNFVISKVHEWSKSKVYEVALSK